MSYTENIDVNNEIQSKLNKTSESKTPVAMIIAGQPGAGKSSVEHYLKNGLNKNVITIDPDAMRRFHPNQGKFQVENDKTAANHTHEDASRWAEKMRDVAIENRRNIIIDGTLKSPDKAESLCNMLKEKGYRVEVHAIAVNNLQSKLGIVDRYEDGKDKNGYGRWVPEHVHDDAYNGVLKSLKLIEDKKLADAVCVHTRDDKNIYENRLNDKGEYSQEKPHAVEKMIEQREQAFSKETQEHIKNSLDKTEALMVKRNAPQFDKNYLSDLSSSIEIKIMKNHMREISKDSIQKIDKPIEPKKPSLFEQAKAEVLQKKSLDSLKKEKGINR